MKHAACHRMRQMKKLLYILSFLPFVAMSGLSGCKKTDAMPCDTDSVAIRLGVLPTIDCLPFYYADSTGIFDSLGIDVRLVTYDAAMDADTAFAKGYIDAIATDLVKACLWEDTDSVRLVMNGDLRLWLVTARNARLLKAESLKEKIIGITRHSAVDFFTDKVLESAKLKSIDLNKPQINNMKLRMLMTDQNQYDGAILPEPHASEAVARGAKRLASTMELNLHGLFCVAVSGSINRTRKADADKLREAYDMAVRAINADTMISVCGYFPKEHAIYLPDTLFTYEPLNESAPPNDSIKQIVKAWLMERQLIKRNKK